MGMAINLFKSLLVGRGRRMINKEVNPHFEDFIFDWEHEVYVLLGGYGSSKSYHIALKIILKLLEEKRTCLVVREVYDTIRDSCFELFVDIASEMNLYSDKRVNNKIQFVTSPMQIRFPNGSKIIFKGMDKPEKLKSVHNVSLIWGEEASELKYKGFKELLGRLRHPTLKTHIILSWNPTGKSNWTYKHFFVNGKLVILDDSKLYTTRIIVIGKTYYHHSTADDNLFLPLSYVERLDELKIYDPDLHRVAREGKYGTNGKKVLPQFSKVPHAEVMEAINGIRKPLFRNGMDFGFSDSYNAVLRMAIDTENHYLYIYWEYYKNDMTDDETIVDLEEFRQSGELVIADSAEPKTIRYYKKQGFNMKGAIKFPGSRLANIKKVKRFKKIICSEECENTIHELENLVYKKDRSGNTINDEFNIDPHTFSAVWYGLDGYEVENLKESAKKVPKKRPQGRRRTP